MIERRESSSASLFFWPFVLSLLLGQFGLVVLLIRQAGAEVPFSYGLFALVGMISKMMAIALLIRTAARFADGSKKNVLLPEKSWEFLLIIVAYVLLAQAYMWGKVFVPAFNHHLVDAALARIDRLVCLGINPNVFLLTIFGGAHDQPGWTAIFLDSFYSAFVPMMLGITAFFVTGTSAARRGFLVAMILLWSSGFWLYIAFPSVGPVFGDPALKTEIAAVFPRAAGMQQVLLNNYQALFRLLRGEAVQIFPGFGIAAMPSLHVGAEALFFFWCVFRKSAWRSIFLMLGLLTWIGSVATGWHWFVDGLAGVVLAFLAALVGRNVAAALGDPVFSADYGTEKHRFSPEETGRQISSGPGDAST